MNASGTIAEPFRWAGRRVAVTGGTGFLGHHVCAALRATGAHVTALTRAFSDTSRLRALGLACQIAPLEEPVLMTSACRGAEVVIHVAGAVHFGGDWSQCHRVNVTGTANLIRAAAKAGVRRVVHVSSMVAVGATAAPTPLDETAHWDLAPLRVPYITTKRLGEELMLRAKGFEVVVVNPSALLGPGDFTGSEFGVLCYRFWRHRLPVVFGGGTNFVDVRDVAIGILQAVDRGRDRERYILGGVNRSYATFFSELAKVLGEPVGRVRLPSFLAPLIATVTDRRTRGRPLLSLAQARLMGRYFYADTSRAERDLGYQSRPLAETLAETLAFWRSPAAPVQAT